MKKFVSLFVVLCLIISTLTITPTIASAQYSGKCGDYLTWALEDGVLTVSGTGNMDNYLGYIAPWDGYRYQIKKIIIEDGVKSIGSVAFASCSNLSELSLGNSLATIEKAAFKQCEKITEVIIPRSVKTIGNDAFLGCENLTDLTISDGVTTIGEYAFSGCESLTEVTIPRSVTSIGRCAFLYCWELTTVNLPQTFTNTGNIDTKIIKWYDPNGRKMYLPDGTSRIVSQNQVEDFIKNGWYKMPVQSLYSLDGRKIVVEKAQVKDYAKVGWYENLADVQQYIYSPSGKSAVVYKSEVPSYTAVGWSTTPLSFKTNSKLPITFTYNKNVVTNFTINDFYITRIDDRANNKNIVFDIDYTGPSEFPIEFLSYDINGNLLATEEVNLRIFSYVSVPKATASLIIRAKTNDNNPVYCYNEYINLYSSSGKSINVPYLLQNTYYPEYTSAVIMFDKDGNEVSVEPSKVNDYVNKGYYQDYAEYIYYTSFTPKYKKHMNNKEYDEA